MDSVNHYQKCIFLGFTGGCIVEGLLVPVPLLLPEAAIPG